MTNFPKVTVQAAHNGWIVTIDNSTPEVFIRWEQVLRRIESVMIPKGDGDE